MSYQSPMYQEPCNAVGCVDPSLVRLISNLREQTKCLEDRRCELFSILHKFTPPTPTKESCEQNKPITRGTVVEDLAEISQRLLDENSRLKELINQFSNII
jgi:hypothetical protein